MLMKRGDKLVHIMTQTMCRDDQTIVYHGAIHIYNICRAGDRERSTICNYIDRPPRSVLDATLTDIIPSK